MKIIRIAALTMLSLVLTTGVTHAEEQQLRCRLMSKGIVDTEVKVPGEHTVLTAFRDGGICLFEDGSVADKLFVAANMASPDFSTGSYAGFSVYTFENGDSLTLSFMGGWGKNGNKADYQVVSGTGAYRGATGTGTITGRDSPWDGTSWFDIAIDISVGG